MRIHSDHINQNGLVHAAKIAHVVIVSEIGAAYVKRSRIRDHAFDVKLEGDSRRPPNGGVSGVGTGYAATWDQWGVFLSVLFDADPDMVAGSGLKYAVYNGRDGFHEKTFDRFQARTVVGEARTFIDIPQGELVDYWPTDAHGDHSWDVRSCRKCSAQR